MQRMNIVLVALCLSSAAARLRQGREANSGKMNPEVVAHTLANVETEWMQQAMAYVACNGTTACTEDSMSGFSKSCQTVVHAIVEGSNGNKADANEYLNDICSQGVLEGSKSQLCNGLAKAVDDHMTEDSYVNREELNLDTMCRTFLSQGFMKKAADTEIAHQEQLRQQEITEEQKKEAEEKAAEEKRKKEEEEQAAQEAAEEAAKKKAEEAQAKADAAKQAAEAAQRKREEAEAKAAEAAQKHAEAAAAQHRAEAVANGTAPAEQAATNATVEQTSNMSASVNASEAVAPATNASVPAANSSEPTSATPKVASALAVATLKRGLVNVSKNTANASLSKPANSSAPEVAAQANSSSKSSTSKQAPSDPLKVLRHSANSGVAALVQAYKEMSQK